MLCTVLLQALKGDRLSSVFSPDGTLIFASAAPHCGVSFISFHYFMVIVQGPDISSEHIQFCSSLCVSVLCGFASVLVLKIFESLFVW